MLGTTNSVDKTLITDNNLYNQKISLENPTRCYLKNNNKVFHYFSCKKKYFMKNVLYMKVKLGFCCKI